MWCLFKKTSLLLRSGFNWFEIPFHCLCKAQIYFFQILTNSWKFDILNKMILFCGYFSASGYILCFLVLQSRWSFSKASLQTASSLSHTDFFFVCRLCRRYGENRQRWGLRGLLLLSVDRKLVWPFLFLKISDNAPGSYHSCPFSLCFSSSQWGSFKLSCLDFQI